MTFEEWWDSTGTNATPETYKGWEESCRQAWVAGQAVEREACKEDCILVIEKRNTEGLGGFNAIHDCLDRISKRSN